MLRPRPGADRVPGYWSDAGRTKVLGAAFVAFGGWPVGAARAKEEVGQLLFLQGATPDEGAVPAALDDVLLDLLRNMKLREVRRDGDLGSELLVPHGAGGVEGGWRIEKIFEETSKPVPALRLKEATPRAKMNALKFRILP